MLASPIAALVQVPDVLLLTHCPVNVLAKAADDGPHVWGPVICNPHGKFGLSSRLLALVWTSPSQVDILGSVNQQKEDFFVTDFQIKYIFKNRKQYFLQRNSEAFANIT